MFSALPTTIISSCDLHLPVAGQSPSTEVARPIAASQTQSRLEPILVLISARVYLGGVYDVAPSSQATTYHEYFHIPVARKRSLKSSAAEDPKNTVQTSIRFFRLLMLDTAYGKIV
jgi:hypothetical protein